MRVSKWEHILKFELIYPFNTSYKWGLTHRHIRSDEQWLIIIITKNITSNLLLSLLWSQILHQKKELHNYKCNVWALNQVRIHAHTNKIYPSKAINIHCISAFYWPFIGGVKTLTCIKLIEQIPQHFHRSQNAQSDHSLLIKQHKSDYPPFQLYDWIWKNRHIRV